MAAVSSLLPMLCKLEPPTAPPTPPAFVASTLNSVSLTWSFPTPSTELPTVLGYHIQRRGHGRACADGAGEASVWKRAADFQVLSYEDVARNGIVPPTAVTIYGLAADTAYCFRARARTAGGWGPFSSSTPGYRTRSATSTSDQRETVRLAAVREGAKGVANVMEKHKNIGAVQRYAAEALATMAMKGRIERTVEVFDICRLASSRRTFVHAWAKCWYATAGAYRCASRGLRAQRDAKIQEGHATSAPRLPSFRTACWSQR
jgi:hypothetical protein